MPKIGPYLVLILSKSPFFQKSPCEKEILCHFFYLDNKISAQLHIQTGHCQFWGLFGFKLETTVVGHNFVVCLYAQKAIIIMWRYRVVLIIRIYGPYLVLIFQKSGPYLVLNKYFFV